MSDLSTETVGFKPGHPNTKWGAAVTGGWNGYQLVPDVLLRNQVRLGLSPTDMLVLLNITMHWWERDPLKLPHPRPEQIAARIGVTSRTVQRSIRKLVERGLVQWMPSEPSGEGVSVRRFQMAGLVAALEELAREFEVAEVNAA
jgi:hypothetical protein